jgi:5-methylcytosine-specific restriction enzyme A
MGVLLSQTAVLEMPEVIKFTVGKEYRRSDLHDVYGGSRQGGISPSAKSPIVLLFTGESGKQYGYLHDSFQENGTYWYTGEGRKGDMRMIKGNLAVRNSATGGKQLHLFEQTRKGFAQYLGEFSYLDHHEDRAPDSDGELRNVVVFELELVSDKSDFTPVSAASAAKPVRGKFWNLPLHQLRDLASGKSSKDQTAATRKRMVYERSEAVRVYVLRRANGKCEGCEQLAPFNNNKGDPYLEPHHITRVADKGPDNPQWVAALCPNCHRRIHFGEDGDKFNIAIAEKVSRLEKALANPGK